MVLNLSKRMGIRICDEQASYEVYIMCNDLMRNYEVVSISVYIVSIRIYDSIQ